jgi:hypothetical protein
MRLTILFVLFALVTNFKISGQTIPVPPNYTIVDTVSGDLDSDGKRELVVAYNTKEEGDLDENVPRELIIYKMLNSKWTIWKKSQHALYNSRDGGMMGDPFGEMEIKNRILLISHNGGSSWKWGHTDKYRYQNGEFYLVGYVSDYGKPCEYWTDLDFNLATGKMMFKKEYEECKNKTQEIYKRENETFYKNNIKITIQSRNEKEIIIVTPKYKHEIYLASGPE